MFLGMGELYKWDSNSQNAAYIKWDNISHKWVEIYTGTYAGEDKNPSLSPNAISDKISYSTPGGVQVISGSWANEGNTKVVPISPTGNYDVIEPPSYYTEEEMVTFFKALDAVTNPVVAIQSSNLLTEGKIFGLPWYVPTIGIGIILLFLGRKLTVP